MKVNVLTEIIRKVVREEVKKAIRSELKKPVTESKSSFKEKSKQGYTFDLITKDIKDGKILKNRCLKNSTIFKSFIANLLYKRFEIVNPDIIKNISTPR